MTTEQSAKDQEPRPAGAGPVRLVIAPAFGGFPDLRWAAATVALWFDAAVQVASDDGDHLDAIENFSAYAELDTLPVLHVSGDDVAGHLSEQLDQKGPGVMTLPASPAGVDVARRLRQPSFLVPHKRFRRLSTGPLVVPIDSGGVDVDVVSVTALWAVELGCDVELVASHDADDDAIDRTTSELESMGVRVGVERCNDVLLRTDAAATRTHATAIVVGANSAAEERFVVGAQAAVLVCPNTGHGGSSAVTRRVLSMPSRLESLTESACNTLLAGRNLGRLGYIDGNEPHVVPVNYRAHEGVLYIRSLAGQKLAQATERPRVCLEVDDIDEWTRSGWSVSAHGPMEVIDDPAVLADAWTHAPDPWLEATEHRWLRIVPDRITGRQTSR